MPEAFIQKLFHLTQRLRMLGSLYRNGISTKKDIIAGANIVSNLIIGPRIADSSDGMQMGILNLEAAKNRGIRRFDDKLAE